MTKQTIAEILLIILVFKQSFLVGIMVLSYIIYSRDKYKCLSQMRSLVKKSVKSKKIELPEGTADKILFHKGCTIEKYDNQFIIVKPSGKRLMKAFKSLEDAKKEINFIAPFLVIPKVKGREVQNIRFVK